jgi:hypothetical protein
MERDGKITEPNMNFMSYDYDFVDENVKQVASIVDSVSEPSRSIFYALKVISKRQFSRKKKDVQTLLSQKYIEDNGKIFLDLMEDLCRHFQEGKSDVKSIVKKAKQRIYRLVLDVRKDVLLRKIVDNTGFISDQINNFVKRKK